MSVASLASCGKIVARLTADTAGPSFSHLWVDRRTKASLNGQTFGTIDFRVEKKSGKNGSRTPFAV
jgi:hypothetical protein